MFQNPSLKILKPKTEEPNFRIPWKQDVWDRVHKRQEDCIIAIVGKRRKGKSTLGLNFGESFDPKGFTPENLQDQCFMSPLKFLEWAKRPKDQVVPGTCLVFDEAGVGIPADEWMTFNSKVIKKVMQIFGNKYFVLVFTLPNLGYLAKGPRTMIDYIVEVIGYNRRRSITMAKVKEMRVNTVTGDYKTPFCRYRINGKWYKFARPYIFKKPSIKLMHAYDKLQEEYKQDFEDEIFYEAKRLHKEKMRAVEKKLLNEDEIIKKIIENKSRYLRIRGSRVYVDANILTYDFNLGNSNNTVVKRIKTAVELQLKAAGEFI